LLSSADRKNLRAVIEDSGLELPAVNESLTLDVPDATHRDNLERLRLAAALFHDLAPGKPALIETTMGGKTAEWEQVRGRMAERLHAWADAGKAVDMRIAVKAHVGSAVDRPERCAWLMRQVNSPWMRLGYDYSHFHLIGLDLEQSLREMIGQTSIIHV